MLTLRADHRLGSFHLKLDVSVPSSGVTALFGRSGAGKSSVVSLLAGLLKPDSGYVKVGDTVLFDSAAGLSVPPEQRRLGYVFQEGRLFPHLSVRNNLLFGHRRIAAEERRVGFDEVVALLDIAPLLDRRPRDLSGGEKQRVAIGRALLASPKLLLMDEPLASLDAERKNEIIPFIEKLRDSFGIPIVYVTHDLGEIVRLADRVILMSEGAAAFTGSVEELVGRPRHGRHHGPSGGRGTDRRAYRRSRRSLRTHAAQPARRRTSGAADGAAAWRPCPRAHPRPRCRSGAAGAHGHQHPECAAGDHRGDP